MEHIFMWYKIALLLFQTSALVTLQFKHAGPAANMRPSQLDKAVS